LTLGGNQIGNIGAQHLGQALQHNTVRIMFCTVIIKVFWLVFVCRHSKSLLFRIIKLMT